MSELRYRPDIDGLRAIAVLSVVLFHAGVQTVSGGYSGVDVFFVISGFLITSIIAKEIRRGDFSLVVFYERRVRRILPAFFAVVIFTAVAAYALFLPKDAEDFGKSLAAAALSVSNILFWRESGYFDSVAELKPLLHTWSLGVEEQFYVFFPVLLLLISRFFKQRWTLWIALIAMVSFLISVWGAKYQPSAAFYLLPTRAWELALGGLLALGSIPAVHQRHLREFEALFGVGLIAWGIVMLSPESVFPGANALFPCVGAAMVIHAGSSGPSLVGHLLSWRPLVLVGLISYSLYLWHWPLLVFAKYYLVRPLTNLETSTVIAASFVAAIASWHLIERPFRKRKELIDRRVVFSAGVVATAVVASFGIAASQLHGWPGRIPDDAMKLAQGASDVSASSRSCLEKNQRAKKGEALCVIGNEVGVPNFVVLGDSHAGALMPGIASSAKAHGQTGWHAAMQSCPPLDGVTNRNDEIGVRCRDFRDRVFDLIESTPSVHTVVLVARWTVYAEGSRYGRDDAGPKPVLVDMKNQVDGNRDVFTLGLERAVSRLRKANKHVYIVAPIPEIGWNVPSVSARNMLFGHDMDIRPSIAEFDRRNGFVLSAIGTIAARHGAKVIFPHELLCAGGHCATSAGGRSLYSDDDHLSVYGAESIIQNFDPIFENQL